MYKMKEVIKFHMQK